ncbi:RNA polymerase B [Puccinia graminis f. sp. tritici]|uniref:RNA polymerase B n=1 Tax=Puccinia graminis f. sp. tritici TaxID=56615 RepID=A0A5B0PYY7_PUCGR|nr:RNA polymerase B [Puccinia graminis f. sp. tritici]
MICLSFKSHITSIAPNPNPVIMDSVYKKTHEYVNQFARFNSTDSAQAARQILSKDTTLKQFELAQLASLCPEEAEEAKSLIPSIAGKDDDALQALLNEISGLKRYQG